MGEWRKTTAKVLNHLRSVFDDKALKNATEQEQAAVKRVWAGIGVKMLEYWEDVDGLWGKIKPNRRRGVRQQLLTRFPEEAFLDNERGKAARDEFTRADLLAWGEQLRAEDAANAAAAANAATSAEGVQGDPRVSEADVQDALRLFVLEKPEGGEAVDAAAASAAAGAAVAARVAVDAANAAVLRMLARRPVNTADEAAGPTNAERDSQMESSPTTASWPRPSAPFMATQHPAPFNTQGVRNYSPAYPPTPLPPLFNVSDAMLMGGGGALNAALRTAAGLGGKTSRKSHSSRSSPNMSPAGRSVVSDVSRKSRSNRSTPNLSPNPSPPMSTGVASDLSNLRCLDYVQLCRDVANGSLQLDDERPLTRKELRAAEREAKLRRAARAQEKIDQANTNSTIQLLIACLQGDIDAARQLLDTGADVDQVVSEGYYKGAAPLHAACESGHVDAARLLLEKGAAVDRAMEDGRTPLYIAYDSGHVDVARLLLDNGAKVDRADKFGHTLLQLVCGTGHVDAARLLLDKGAKVDLAKEDGTTPLYIACRNGHVDAARLLLDKGAKVDRADKDGRTPLDIAKSQDHSAVVALLEEHQKRPPPGARR